MIPDIGVEVDASGLEAWFGNIRQRFEVEVMRALVRVAELASAYARQSGLFKSRTGVLRSSIEGAVTGGFGGETAGARVKAKAPYAVFVENGQKAHVIVPRRAGALRFVQNGAVRFAKIVHHPGAAPRPFMAEAQMRTVPLFERLVEEAMVRAFA